MSGFRSTATYATAMVLAVLMAVAVGFVGGWYGSRGQREVTTDTVRVTVVDTVAFYQPVPKDSLVVKYVTKVLKATEPAADATDAVVDSTLVAMASQHRGHGDSVAVEIPITQKKYETEAYRAYVSGYEPSLDSIFVYNKTATETIRIREDRIGKWYDRIGFGVCAGAGYGIVHKQADIFVGAAVYVRIWP